ncbi:LacI family DNA-binding transcriptional regulator [Microbacterium sp. NPDC056569]|uniref:LacI family DNA-binding transcriptional regulator n=1 Tax=Microbacterium sp. NPDC056569 TaxID=3345867 RepID=UPI00366F569C
MSTSNRSGATRGPEPVGRANLADVARLAGVSTATASRVLAGRGTGKAASHARVLAAADELGYVVNGLARSMMGVGRRSIAFVSSQMVGPTFAAMASGAESVVTAHGHLFMMCTTHGDPAVEAELIDSLSEQRAAAVLLVGSTPTDDVFTERAATYADKLARVGARLIVCGRPAVEGLPEIASIDYDHVGGIEAAVAHLVTLGHHRIAYVGETDRMTTSQQRYLGYRSALERAGIELDESLVMHTDNFTEQAEEILHPFRAEHPDVTAYVCQTDMIAVGVSGALRAEGVRLPDDVSVVGFDDMPLAGYLTPALSTVHAPFREVGVLAGRIAVGDVPYESPIVLPSAFIARDSSGPLRAK